MKHKTVYKICFPTFFDLLPKFATPTLVDTLSPNHTRTIFAHQIKMETNDKL